MVTESLTGISLWWATGSSSNGHTVKTCEMFKSFSTEGLRALLLCVVFLEQIRNDFENKTHGSLPAFVANVEHVLQNLVGKWKLHTSRRKGLVREFLSVRRRVNRILAQIQPLDRGSVSKKRRRRQLLDSALVKRNVFDRRQQGDANRKFLHVVRRGGKEKAQQ